MVTRWSFNIDALEISDEIWQKILAWGVATRPTWTTIMDHKDRSKEWAVKVGGQVNHRTYDKRDNYYHHAVTGKQAAADLERDHADMRAFPNIWQYYRGNELGGEWNQIQDWLIEFATEAKKRGFKITSCGLALGKNWKDPDFIKNGNADALLDYAMANLDTFRFAFHDYVTGPLWSPQIQSYPSALFNRELLLANEHIPVLVDSYTGYQGFVNWGCFRGLWLANARAIEKYGKPLPCIIDEGLFDFNAHIIEGQHTWSKLPNGQTVKTEDEIRKYGESQFNRDVRGILGHRKYLTWVFTGDTKPISDDAYGDIVMRNFQWAERSYPANVEGIDLFGINPDWRFPEGHDYIPLMDTLLPKMKALAVSPTPPPDPEPQPEIEWQAMNIQGYNRVRKLPVDANVRLTPNGSVIGILPAMPVVTSAKVSLAPATIQDGFEWIQVILHPDTDHALTGWIASHVFQLAQVAPPVDPRVPLLLNALKAVRNEYVENVGEVTAQILYIDEIIKQAETA
jgi:hypothetical protein